ncbi:MAG: hypothetical protein GX950_03190 [Candidatus Diapherotrites archaeon]|uniref:Uncharacterized protein n=1 Tax=Candidatus Iainarchaeum sp. TaxID=3101447 RepID=A0A7K4C002_9ARCH|nr:hypothetical protein [Candidatus Diapherotrites archaeon]
MVVKNKIGGNKVDDKASIISIIQEMVQNNASESEIISSLMNLGVSQDQAKRLLLIAQADTFTLLRSEIDALVKKSVAEQSEFIKKDFSGFVDNLIDEKKELLKKEIEEEFLKTKLANSAQQKQFQDSINDSVSKLAKLNEEVHLASKENEKTINLIKKDLDETKLKGIKVRNSFFRLFLIGLALIFFAFSLFFLISLDIKTITSDSIIAVSVLAFIGGILTYLSINI